MKIIGRHDRLKKKIEPQFRTGYIYLKDLGSDLRFVRDYSKDFAQLWTQKSPEFALIRTDSSEDQPWIS